jgi:hypothetical protein
MATHAQLLPAPTLTGCVAITNESAAAAAGLVRCSSLSRSQSPLATNPHHCTAAAAGLVRCSASHQDFVTR